LFQEAPRLDLHGMSTQRPDPARVEVEAEIQQWKSYGNRARGAELDGRGQPVLSHGAELRIAETGNARRDVIVI
jgi:hypothetical protein